jgi:hypothetical protein
MLVVSLVLSAILLLIVNGVVWLKRDPDAIIVCVSLVFFLLMCLFPAVGIQGLLVCGTAYFCRAIRRGPSFFLPLSCGATLVVYGILGIGPEREFARLRVRYPYESMERRLPKPRSVPAGMPLRPATVERLDRMEREIPEHANGYREHQLWRLHEDAVGLFINSPGFGNMRMIYPTESGLAVNLRREPVPFQPGSRFASTWSPGELKLPVPGDGIPLSQMLDTSILDFVNPRGFGYLKDRRHVAGFESHRFSQVPEPANRWKVQTLELVGLLLHDEPEVYVSDHLPQMDKVRGAPARPLDRFEGYALDALRRGEDLFITQEEEGLRMLGAVRSTRRCVDCHAGNRGDLLGALSYTLRSVGP